MLKKQVFFIFTLFYATAMMAQNPVVQFVLDSTSISEGAGSYGVELYILNFNANATSIDINVLPGGTAQHGANYTYSPVTATFPANSQSDIPITINLFDDSIQDGSKFFIFKLANPTNGATIGPDSELIVTITNDDTSHVSFITDSFTVPKDTGIIYLPVNMNLKNDSPVSVQVKVVPDSTTAVLGVDYAFNDTTITWAALTRGLIQVPVTILNDTLFEHNKVIQFTLISATNGTLLTDSIFNLTIQEHDTVIRATLGFNPAIDTIEMPDSTITLGIVSVTGFNGGTTPVYCFVGVNSNLSTAVVGNGFPADFNYSSNELALMPGDSIDTALVLQIFNDPSLGSPKIAVFQFTNVIGNPIISADSLFTLYIVNHNKLSVSFMGAGMSYPKDTGWVMVPLVMSTFSSFPVSADVTLAPGSAINGQDYIFADTTVIFPPFSSDTQGVWVNILGNSVYEANKQINFNLSNPTNGVGLEITGYTITIINNDSLLGISENPGISKFSLYPNPAVSEIYVHCPENLVQLKIYDVLGRLVIGNQEIVAGENFINIENLPCGAYYARFVSQSKNVSIPFVRDK